MTNNLTPIKLKGVSENNLKHVNLEIFPGQLTVFTGLSGAGKSTLLFDVLHAEGQRKYVETFSPYVRQFLESLKRPEAETIENVRPSIAVEQKNTIRNSRSTVGTMTELCDYFKVWFSQVACFHDPESGKKLQFETSETLTRKVLKIKKQNLIFGFTAKRPEKLSFEDFIQFLIQAGHARVLFNGNYVKLESLRKKNINEREFFVVVDRTLCESKNKPRISEAILLSIKHGHGIAQVRNELGDVELSLHNGLMSPVNGHKFSPPSPSSFSFNSPVGACPSCKGFGRVIEIDQNLVIPDELLSLKDNAIKAFSGNVYGHFKTELLNFCKEKNISIVCPWSSLPKDQKEFVWNGDQNWIGIKGFFKSLEKKAYKMHVRVFLSKYRGYFKCTNCSGDRLNAEARCWKWKSFSLPELYKLSIDDLSVQISKYKLTEDPKADIAIENIKERLKYLQDVGLGYLSLDRSARSLSGGETQRVNLTACLGASLTDTLFALDEPTIGLHGTDVGKLISILRSLANSGNCVCVVEHDEQVINAADRVIEIGPLPGKLGGEISFNGTVNKLKNFGDSITAKWINKDYLPIYLNAKKRTIRKKDPHLHLKKVCKHNIKNLSATLPLSKYVCIAGVSGSGKSTLVNDIIYEGMKNKSDTKKVSSDIPFSEVLLIDQSSVVRTPRSNPVLYSDAWTPIKEAFGRTDASKRLGFLANDYSFNSGNGRCDSCGGLGYELVEMQFLSDIQIPCNYCNGKRFKDDILQVRLDGLNLTDVLELTIDEAIECFKNLPKTFRKLKSLQKIGLGYLKLGQPLNTLSGGESQRLKLVKYMTTLKKGAKPSLLIIDEPTTGLHLQDVSLLTESLQHIVETGHSLFVVEHHPHILAQSDWIIELGPKAGKNGGKIISSGLPSRIAKLKTPTAEILNHDFMQNSNHKSSNALIFNRKLEIKGANENNLNEISLSIPSNKFVVITGPSGSGKSSLAFNVIFAEGQRRFMESMSSYARQFIEQIGKPLIDSISGISPTVAIEQRTTRGSKKSTVGSITEIAQFLRLLYSRLGIQLSVRDGNPLSIASESQIVTQVERSLKKLKPTKHSPVYLLAPLVSNRKGHHKPAVNWAAEKGYNIVRCDDELYETSGFKGLDRYRVHNVEILLCKWGQIPSKQSLKKNILEALKLGKGRVLIASSTGQNKFWFSTSRVDMINGESYPELEPSLLSWNSQRGWCVFCRGYGKIYDWMKDDLPANGDWWSLENGDICPECKGERLNQISRNIVLKGKGNKLVSLPKLLSFTPDEIICFLKSLKLDPRAKLIASAIVPEVLDRLNFMNNVGLNYLSLNRETSSLSGGEAQRIRLSAQLGSNLSGVLYILDEPSIGLHPKDNKKLIESLRNLQKKGNSLIVVEHDPETISQADLLIDIGPEAGIKGGNITAIGKPSEIKANFNSATIDYLHNGIRHPIRGNWRKLPAKSFSEKTSDWLKVENVNFRNLKNISLTIPTEKLSVCCGVSGSGKSSLIRGFLADAVRKAINENSKKLVLEHGTIHNGHIFNKLIEVTQSPIGKTPRSTPATYLGVWDQIRTMISSLPEAKARGFSPSHFSFNVKGGRCELCKGAGRIKVEMNFLPNSYIICSECEGKRYRKDILNLTWNSKNIFEILELTFEDAAEFFKFDHVLHETFSLMVKTGLGYIKLGQISPTLSGGESQRLKLAAELANGIDKQKYKRFKKSKPNLYILEEPTIGLHTTDCKKLISLLHRLVDEGNSVIVIEHDIDIIAEADFLFELGPKGGMDGGKVTCKGTVKQITSHSKSQTAPFLKKIFH